MSLFSESAGRVLVSLPEANLAELRDLAASRGVATATLGRVGAIEGAAISVAGEFSVSLAELRVAWRAPIREALGV